MRCMMAGMVGSCRLELQTSCVSSRRSNQLSYEPELGSCGQRDEVSDSFQTTSSTSGLGVKVAL